MEIIKKYYRLWDRQCDRYMETGYNARGKKDLFGQYADYKSNDWDGDYDEGEETMFEVWDKMTDKEKMSFIRDDEFEIESSFIKFKEMEY